MIKFLVAASLSLMLGACSTISVQPATGKPVPAGPPPPPMIDEGIVCAADVRLCPEGGYVSRDPARGCAFAPCPGADNQ